MIDAIEIEHLYKSYGALSVLRGLSLRVARGEVYGLLGTHGAGKSTLIHLLLGFLTPNSGILHVLGTPELDVARDYIGYVPERASYHLRYSAREYLFFLGRFSDIPGRVLPRRIDEQLQRVGLSAVADHGMSTFSPGMLQRLGIAQALLTHPQILLIDDPLRGLDTAEQRQVIDVLTDVHAQGYTMLICGHCVAAMAQICDRIGVLFHGYIAGETTRQQLRIAGTSIKIQVDQLPQNLRSHLTSISSGVTCGEQTVALRMNSQELQTRVLRTLLDSGVTILSLEPLEHPLEQFYMEVIQRASRMERNGGQSRQEHRTSLDTDPFADRAADHANPQQDGDPLLDTLLLGNENPEYERRGRDD